MTKLSHVLFRVPGIWSVLNKFYIYIYTHMCTDCVCSYSIPYGAWGQLYSVDLSLCPWGILKVHGLSFFLCTCLSSLGEAFGREGPCWALCHWVLVLWLWRSDLSQGWWDHVHKSMSCWWDLWVTHFPVWATMSRGKFGYEGWIACCHWG